MSTELAPRQRLAELEAVIERGLKTFTEVGQALLEIRGSRLYLEDGYTSFENYCQNRWRISRPRAYQLIQAAEIVEQVSTTVDSTPRNEAQARELARLPDPEARREAWQAVVEAHGDDVTASNVREAVDTRLGSDRLSRKPPVRAVPETEPEWPDTDEAWQCAGCDHWYASEVTDCPRCQPALIEPEPPAMVRMAASPDSGPTMEDVCAVAGDADGALERQALRVQYARGVAAIRNLLVLVPEAVAAAIDDSHAADAADWGQQLAAWVERLQAARAPGLRLVHGKD